MKNEIEFYEKQSQKPWWMWLLMIAINIPFIYGFIQQIILGNIWGNNPMSDIGLIIVTSLTILFSVVFLRSKLETIINSEGVYVRYIPFNLSYKFFNWNDISKAYIREYHAIKEFGGMGIRISTKGKAYIVSGNYGLQLELKNEKKVLIGTQYPDEIGNELNTSPLSPLHRRGE